MPPSSAMKTPSRRMTLGPVPSSNSRGRPSIELASATKPARPPRASMIPRVGRENAVPASPSVASKQSASSRRRSSIGGRQSIGGGRRQSLVPPAVGTRTDPRPIKEKAFQQKSIKNVLDYLMEAGYEYPVTQRTLSGPSPRDFEKIITFLLRKVDPNFQKGQLKLADEIATNFKSLGYPFTISKTSLTCPGASHTWASLLAAITWLVDFLRTWNADDDEEDQTETFKSIEELEIKTDRFFFKYLHGAYDAFLRNDQAKTEQLEVELADRFEHDDGIIAQEIERVTDLNALAVEKITALESQSQALPNYAKKREDYLTDLEQFQDLIREMNEHKASMQQKVDERSEKVKEVNEKIERLTKHIEDLKNTVASQELSLEDLAKMENEQKGVREALDRAMNQKNQKSAALVESEKNLVDATGKLDEAITQYQDALSSLSMFEGMDSITKDLKVSLVKENLLKEQTDFLGVDIESDALSVLADVSNDYRKRLEDAKAEYQDALDELEKAEEAFQEVQYKLDVLREKRQKNEEIYEQEKESHEAKLSVRKREIQSMEEKIASLRDPVALEEQMASYERQCAELEALIVRHQEENLSKKKAVENEINQATMMMQEQQMHLRQKISELHEYMAKKKAAQEKLHVPDIDGLNDL